MAEPVSAGNKFVVCQYRDHVASFGIWLHRNPLHYSTPLLILQLAVISCASLVFDICLQPLGQSSIVSQILGGVIFGPSFLGHKSIMGNSLFPSRSVLNLETLASFGIVFFLFAIGIRTDPMKMIMPGRPAALIGTAAMLSTLVLTVSLAFVLKSHVPMDDTLASALPFIASAQSLTAYPNISCLLAELKMSGSNVGQLAASSSLFCDLIGMGLLTIALSIVGTGETPLMTAMTVLEMLLFLGLMYAILPFVRRLVKRIPTNKPLEEHHVFACFTGNLLAALVSEVLGQHYVLGPLVFGLLVPEGPPLGAAIISKLDYPVGKFLYPTFLTTSGLRTNIFKIRLQSLWIVMLVVLFSCIAKIGAVVSVSRFLNIRFHDSVVIGLVMNARGACEIIMFNLWRDSQVLQDQEFALCILVSVLGVTAIITPLIKLLYDPSKELVPVRRRTIQHSKRDLELRILVCINDHENVPSFINLLEASHATEESPIAVIAILLEELVGRATPMLVAYQSTRTLQPNNSKSGHIMNALRQYELCNERCVTIQSFCSISHMETMHDDICRVALDQNVTIVILPFHKHWEIDGSIGSISGSTRNMNVKVLEKSPCSVGILVDRGMLTGSLSILNNQSIYRVAVIYIGGRDDAESLCYGARMGKHSNVTLTVFRFLLFGCDNARDRKIDNSLIDEVRHANIGNENFVYQEQIVKDGVGLAASLRALEGNYDLMIVGRNHPPSPILTGLGAWSECPELGEVGDILASPDVGSTSSVLVVQQQRLMAEKFKNRLMKPVVISHESAHDHANPIVGVDHDDRREVPMDRDRC